MQRTGDGGGRGEHPTDSARTWQLPRERSDLGRILLAEPPWVLPTDRAPKEKSPLIAGNDQAGVAAGSLRRVQPMPARSVYRLLPVCVYGTPSEVIHGCGGVECAGG